MAHERTMIQVDNLVKQIRGTSEPSTGIQAFGGLPGNGGRVPFGLSLRAPKRGRGQRRQPTHWKGWLQPWVSLGGPTFLVNPAHWGWGGAPTGMFGRGKGPFPFWKGVWRLPQPGGGLNLSSRWEGKPPPGF